MIVVKEICTPSQDRTILQGTKAISHMFLRNGFKRLAVFLLGHPSSNGDSEAAISRRWSSVQSREFGNLHVILATLILNCNVAPYRTIGS
ncbi:hypothetical protein DPMN_091464 [Dreissena polymorpha]|uniref:Uncharacterized protein n=1 Tax=Dreissena polymorpha TaxID=45954 RepID=A0A9D4R0R2_DREPO|nr:hypothetical protein DPMN_091464 [Dreissena polymorpha]